MNLFGRAQSAARAVLLLILTIFCGVATEAAPPLETYGRLPGFETATISPSGDHLALIGRVNDARLLLIFGENSQLVKQIALGDAKIRDLQWAGDDMLLLGKSDTVALGVGFTADKAELFSTIVIPLNGKTPWRIFDGYSAVTGGVRGFYGLNERDGKWFGYFSGITLDRGRAGEYLSSTNPVLYEVDLQNGKVRKIAARTDNQLDYRTWLVDRDGNAGVQLDFRQKSGDWLIRDGDNNVIARGNNPWGEIDLVGFGNVPGTVLYKEGNVENGEQRWFELPLTGGEAREILGDVYIHRKILDNRSRSLIGYQIEGDRPSFHFYNPYHQKVITAVQKAFPDLSMNLIDWNDSFTRLVVTTEGADDPITWHIVDIKTGKADVLGTSYPMQPTDVGPMKMIRYKATDGLDIEAVLTLPAGRAPRNLPVIMLPHGGPGSRDYPRFDWWAQAFASRGYAVLQPNFRGSTGYGTEFELAGHGQWGRGMQTDISEGLAHLVKQGIADPKRACIMGASYGGYAALVGVTVQQGHYRCAVSVAGISDLRKMVRTDISESGNRDVVRRALRREIGSGKDLDAVSPIRFAAAVKVPILLIHGKDDTVVDYDQSNDMEHALRSAAKTVELVTLKSEDHWLSKSETRMEMLEAAMAFLLKYNPPDSVQEAAPESGPQK